MVTGRIEPCIISHDMHSGYVTLHVTCDRSVKDAASGRKYRTHICLCSDHGCQELETNSRNSSFGVVYWRDNWNEENRWR